MAIATTYSALVKKFSGNLLSCELVKQCGTPASYPRTPTLGQRIDLRVNIR